MDGNYASRLVNSDQAKTIDQDVIDRQGDFDNAKAVHEEAMKSQEEITAEAVKQEGLMNRMLDLQEKVTKNVKQELVLKIQMANKGMQTGVAAKQAQEQFKDSLTKKPKL